MRKNEQYSHCKCQNHKMNLCRNLDYIFRIELFSFDQNSKRNRVEYLLGTIDKTIAH